ncbi:DNA primase small subunit PriS [Sulfurisphaera tokodaii]|uniref:DNA primase small subunit PriS n=1 Tax=Sulfurisphaera tokodaii TaxID=111955 RepID=A0A832T243_9CREN|nr:DNA primase small subunit PriS [Sulfurisphaera tokodaii]HII73917.1 DNA primase small subunit PriS [Sulfurisphaera tokodaii]
MQISTLHQEQNKIIKILFSEYYEKAELDLPNDMELREFAYQPFDSETYVRHLSFSSPQELRQYILQNVPLHLYYSSARYQLPSAKEMDEKGWLGSDLLFDLDADEICEVKVRRFCPQDGYETLASNCNGEPPIEYAEITTECIMKVFEKALLIRDILKEDFGLNARIFFSGNRGFHLRVTCYEDCALLDPDDRKEIAEYFTSPKPPVIYEGNPGWSGRIAKGIEGINIDTQVTIDIRRLVRIPGSLNGKAGLMVVEIKNDKFEYGEWLSPFDGDCIFLPYVSAELTLFNNKYTVKRTYPIKIDTRIGVYLALKGLGKVKAYVR